MVKSEVYAAALTKAKVAFGAANDFELSKALGVDPATITKAKQEGRVPFRPIVDKAIESGGDISLDWIFGINVKKSNGGAE
ncbi:hypothetical protein [Sulfuricurvum sp.]|uniref:hypothetical protein n=1 Tax=Sulfuricurvum sp. TaxID=2025608 RepID=UPI002D6C6714|nr:hypothetical protein [Sulfuricurvum sp.]HZF69910.1 hypothetical protein [Sulfuricurvum sp.]